MKERSWSLAVLTFAGAAACVPPSDIDCPDQTSQLAGACVVTCAIDDECLIGEVCDPSGGACLPGSGERPEILELRAAEVIVPRGRPAKLSWSTARTTRVMIDHDALAGSNVVAGSVWTRPVRENTTFTMTAYGPGGRTRRSVQIMVTDQPIAPTVIDFQASPDQVRAGEPATLSWETAGAERIRIVNGQTTIHSTIEERGSIAYVPTGPVTLVLVAENAAGATEAVLALVVEAETPSIEVFEAQPNAALVGGSVNLTWRILGARSMAILYEGTEEVFESSDAQIVAAGTHVVVLPMVQMNEVHFTVSAIGPTGKTASKEVTIAVQHSGT